MATYEEILLDGGEPTNLKENGFKFAFAVENRWRNASAYNPRYFRWTITIHQTKDSDASMPVRRFELYPCTEEDMGMFYEPESEEVANKMTKLQ